MMGLNIAMWRKRSRRQPQKGKNGRRGFTKLPLEQFRQFLHHNSNPTCRMSIGRGKRKAGVEPVARQKRALADTKRQLYLHSPFKAACSQSTWYRQLKAKCADHVACKRKLDMCTKCHAWDETVFPACFASRPDVSCIM